MEKMHLILVLLVVGLVVFAGIQALQVSGLKAKITGTTSNIEAIDMTDWTADEKMNYEMHGIIPARVSKGGSPSVSAMVGGC